MLHKKKCSVCGFRFPLRKDDTYSVVPPKSLSEIFSKATEVWTATDCPRCGCQVLLAPRSAKLKDPAPEVDTEADNDE